MSPCSGPRLLGGRDAPGLREGPAPRLPGSVMQAVQWNRGPSGLLLDFSSKQPHAGSAVPIKERLAFSQLEATVLTQSRFLFTPQEARELLPPPLPPQEDAAGRSPQASACCPGTAVPQTPYSAEDQLGRRGAGPGRLSLRSSRGKDLLHEGLVVVEEPESVQSIVVMGVLHRQLDMSC